MILQELVRKSDYVKTYDLLNEYYCKEKQYGNYDVFESICLKINTMTNIVESKLDSLHVSIYEDTFQGETEFVINVSEYVESEKENYGISFTPWNKLAGLEIEQVNCDFSNEKLLAHIVWSMTFDGWDEETIKKNHDILVEKLKEAEDDIANDRFVSWEEMMEKLDIYLDDEEVDELKAEIEDIKENPKNYKSYNKDNAGSIIDDIMNEDEVRKPSLDGLGEAVEEMMDMRSDKVDKKFVDRSFKNSSEIVNRGTNKKSVYDSEKMIKSWNINN